MPQGTRERLADLVGQIIDDRRFGPDIEHVAGYWEGEKATCRPLSDSESIMAERVSRNGMTIHKIVYTDGREETAITGDYRSDDVGGHIEHSHWRDFDEFLGWLDEIR